MSKFRFETLAHLKLLLNIDGIGPQKIFSLLNRFKDFESVVNARYENLIRTEGISSVLGSKILASKKELINTKEKLEKEINYLENLGGELITYWDDTYPDLLKKIYFPPLIIYSLGKFSEEDKFTVGIVGTRQPTSYGKMMAEKFSRELAEKKITVASGLARGIDSIAHTSTIKAGGRTIAVIGSGLDVIYPPENKKLFQQISENGVIISEFEPGTKPDAQNFPRRNRIISGISLGTLVIETKINGGAMQTAAYALDQNREIFSVPGNITSHQSEGPNRLIQRGEAKLVNNVDDILIELKIKLKPEIGKNIPKPSAELNLFEEKIYNVLSDEPKQIDDIASNASLSTSDCLVNLLTLEFKGMIRQLPGKMFIRI